MKIYLSNYLGKQVNFNVFSWPDMTDTVQLVFICGVTKYLSVPEDLLGLANLRGTTHVKMLKQR